MIMKRFRTLKRLGIFICALFLTLAAGVTVLAKDVRDYTDVHPGDWFYRTVADVSEKGLMTGTDETTFGPARNLERGQLATILYRMAGSSDTEYTYIFPDVADGMFYSAPVTWAYQADVITGYNDGTFGPGDKITREQLATMLYRYAEKFGIDTSAKGNIYEYPDGNSVTDFARDAVSWAVGSGIIKGDKGNINPQGDVSRAVCATMIARFIAPPSVAPSVTGALHVDGGRLCGSDGAGVQLKGISTHGLAWFPEYVNEDCFRQLHEEWKANVIRLAMYTAESGGYCTDGDKEALKNLIRKGVAYAKNQDMYVIIDWHILSDCNPNMHRNEAKEFFAEMSAEYADEKHVLYEICNEPNSGTGWGEIKSYAEEVIGVIRAHDEDGVILVGTPNWSQFVDEAANDPITGYDNIMYTLHYYAATHTDDLRNRMAAALDKGLPVFVSEYGICDASGNGAINEEQANQWMEFLDNRGISSVAWNLSNKAETSAILKSSCHKTSGFEESDLSDSGKWLYHMLTGERRQTGSDEKEKEEDSGESEDGNTLISGDIRIQASTKNSWEEGGKKVYQYELVLKNTADRACTSWEIAIPFHSDITLTSGWNGNYWADRKVLHITSKEYNGKIPAGGTASDIGFIVKGGDGIQF